MPTPPSSRPTSRPDAARFRFAPRVSRWPGTDQDSLLGLLAALSAERRPILLDSAGGQPRRWSVLAFDPLPTRPASSIAEVRAIWSELESADGDPVPGPFAGGWAGALAYDLGVEGEELALPREPWDFPPVVGGLYTDFLVRDEHAGATWLVLGDGPGDGRPSVEERRLALQALVAASTAGSSAARGVEPLRARGPLVRRVSSEEHCARVERVRELIADGELYQANVAHRFTRDVRGAPVDLYRRLRERNPAPYMGYAAWPGGALLSSSPELLLELSGDEVRTRPIKGTAPRGADAAEDAERARELLASAKDRAELAMIVDLERNDLGRIAEPGSVRVGAFPTLESYATVHHLVADVVARPRAGVDAFDVLAALFPGGSITGAPKLRAMEVIAELEAEGRGFFSGALGFVDLTGRAAFNILIRTLLWRPRALPGAAGDGLPGEVSFRVGGGITWSSDARAEDRETLHKGEALAAAIEDAPLVADRGPAAPSS